jgi:VanZ family protein
VRRLVTWVPALVWTALVLGFSSGDFSAENTGSLLAPLLIWLFPWITPNQIGVVHFLVRKAAHLTEYGILALLWFRTLTRGSGFRVPTRALLALAISVITAILDETHQAVVPSRTSSAADVLLDSVGATIALVPACLGWRWVAGATTGALLWVAVIGGLVALTLDLAVGAHPGVLWLTVPAAGALLVYRWRRSGSSS